MTLQRFCPCGHKIGGTRKLCNECRETYGDVSSEWPAWLLFAVNDFQNQYIKEIEYQKYVWEFEGAADGGDKSSLYQKENYIDKDGLLVLRGCRAETFSLIDQ